MRFVWPAQRYDRLTSEALAMAAALTACAGIALSLPIVTIYRAIDGATVPADRERREAINFVQPVAPPARADLSSPLRTARPSSARATRREKALNADTSSRPASRTTPTVAAEVPATTGSAANASTGRALGPFATPVGLNNAAGITEAERERRLKELAPPLPFLANLPPTKEQIDDAARETARRAAVARDEHRPMPVPLGGVAVTLPWGPSPEQRRRDSIIHADNTERLARLAARARAKRDSLLGANTLAGKADSARPAKPDST